MYVPCILVFSSFLLSPRHQGAHLTLAHAEAIYIFRETVEAKKALMNQLCATISETYYKERVSPHTNNVVNPLSVFMTQLFTIYGDINCDIIKEEVANFLDITYDLQQPVMDIFEPIQRLEQLSIAEDKPHTQVKLVYFGVTIVSNIHDFETTIINQHSLPPPNQNWATFKPHFLTTRWNLKKFMVVK